MLFSILISSDIGIKQYVKHLQKEFSLENLIGFVELIQWIYNITEQKWDTYESIISPLNIDNISYKFCKCIPISSINGNNKTGCLIK